MAARKKLQVVDDKPARPTRLEAKRERLAKQRERLAEAFYSPATSPRDLAALSRQLLLIDKEIEELDAVEADSLDGAVSEDADWEAI